MNKGDLRKAIYNLEIIKLDLLEMPVTKEIESAISHIEMAGDFLADLVFPIEEDE